MNAISPGELRAWLQTDGLPLLIDVREEYEHAAFNIGGRLAPMSEFMAHVTNIPRDRPVVLYCEKGIRSLIAIQRLEAMGYENLHNLEGGMKAWREAAGRP